MLSLLLDQQISLQIAEQVRAKRPEIPIQSLYEWHKGALVGASDTIILRAAAGDGLTLVTYDRQTIPPVLTEWGIAEFLHGGVLFIDNRTIATNDFGRLVRTLIYYWSQEHTGDRKNRVGFLPSPPE